jgi:hypothetical protein
MSLLHQLLLLTNTPVPTRTTAIDWTGIKDALHTWLVNATGLDATRVLYGGQNAVRPKGITSAWISIWIMGDEDQGVNSSTIEYFENPYPTPGNEVLKRVTSQSLVTVQITCFAPKDADDASEAYVYLSEAVQQTKLSEVSDPMTDAGVAIQSFSPITTVGGMINTSRIEPKSQLTITFLTPAIVERTLTYIETVNMRLVHNGETPVKAYDFVFDLGS